MRLLPLALCVALLGAQPALAQSPPKLWDIPLGTPITGLGSDFVDPACGTNGGPAGAPLPSFADFAACTPDASGLHEVWFRYDDTLDYMAMAYRNPVAAMQNRRTAVNGQLAIMSLLVDDGGAIRGYRIVTDPRAPERERYEAHIVAATFRALFGTDWNCTDLPRVAGEEPIEGTFVKQRCTVETDTRTATVETHFYLKPGQKLIDPVTGKDSVNAFASDARLEVIEREPYAAAAALVDSPTQALPAGATPAQRFLAGLSNDCPGCQLGGADLRRRDLSGANLAGADLTRAVLHRANLRNADFSGANLTEANLNAADLTLAKFVGSQMRGALLYAVRGTRPDFSRADLSGARLGDIELRQAKFAAATLVKVDLGGARLNDADFGAATLTGSYFFEANLIRAKLGKVSAQDSNFTGAVLRGADLAGGDFHDTDFQGATLEGADLTDATMTHVRLSRANLRNAVIAGTVFTDSLMPDGSTAK
ncbi:pentapeptide repeat-containing protein [Devosia sp. A16]|uniref:pentapeptide repeat-containing protein n=1 Tax=Devosia sp. A16 TaxID=1736675 RepID=UPI000AAD2091|nr:pentapeptide repeat-containing protein [Devosia sp. A16]